VGFASCGKGFLTAFYDINKELRVEIKVGENGSSESIENSVLPQAHHGPINIC
jgi:hypothetical protein